VPGKQQDFFIFADTERFAYFQLLSFPQASSCSPVEEHIFQAQSLGHGVCLCSSVFHVAFTIICFNPKEEKKGKKINNV